MLSRLFRLMARLPLDRRTARLGALAGLILMAMLAALPKQAGASSNEPGSVSAPAPVQNGSSGSSSVQSTVSRAWLPIVSKPPLPAAFAKQSPADNATGLSAGLGVTLTWSASYGALSYQICLSQNTVTPCTDGSGFTHTTSALSWHTGQLAPGGLYFWNVRAINPGGTTYSDGGPAAAYSFQTRPAPGAFSKSQPLHASTGHPALTGVTLSWSAAPNTDAYRVCLSANSNDCLLWDNYSRTTTGTSLASGSLAPNTTYYWNVRADNSSWFSFADGAPSALYTFTTQAAPGAFVKQLPANGSAPASVRLEWTAAGGATSYDICLSTSPATCGNDAGYTINTSSLNYTPSSLSPGVTYFWNVRARNGSGFSYANGSINNIWNFLAPAGSAGDNPCNAPIAAQNTDYTTPQDRTDIYYGLTVNQTSTVDLLISGATGQLQFRTPNSSVCPNHITSLIDYEPVDSGTASIRYYNVTPGTYYARIVTTTPGSNNVTFRWSATAGHTFLEPNNSACAPVTISTNITYTAYPENSRPDLNLGSGIGVENDFYQFTLSAQKTVQVRFVGFNAGARQVQLRSGSCTNTSLVDGSAFVANASNGTIQRTLPAGTYWVRFVTIDGAQSRFPYSFTVSVPSLALQKMPCLNCESGQPDDDRSATGSPARPTPIPVAGETPKSAIKPSVVATPIP
ncbi:MAG: hypothetical protein RMN25_07465 [Anaerolineae bacterium]|nr:fibronectin type III domain-containing protein [Thermoflexales bacterium]MDW8407608.1 hypothetical protein [Anaerolineae bacterium]